MPEGLATTIRQFMAVFLLLSCMLPMPASTATHAECVVVLHGLARSADSMQKMADAFEEDGYAVANEGYPSRKFAIEELAPLAVEVGVAACPADSTVHFVTHSLGGILVRVYMENNQLENLGRVVMLAPPNGGSEVVDNMVGSPGFGWLNGPAGAQLGTDEDSIPSQLGPVDFEVGVIAGTKSINFMLSQYLPNPDDGKVSVERTKVEGMADFITVPHSHPYIMKAPTAISQALAFIETGQFVHELGSE
jgi:triacylglycerol lipase